MRALRRAFYTAAVLVEDTEQQTAEGLAPWSDASPSINQLS